MPNLAPEFRAALFEAGVLHFDQNGDDVLMGLMLREALKLLDIPKAPASNSGQAVRRVLANQFGQRVSWAASTAHCRIP